MTLRGGAIERLPYPVEFRAVRNVPFGVAVILEDMGMGEGPPAPQAFTLCARTTGACGVRMRRVTALWDPRAVGALDCEYSPNYKNGWSLCPALARSLPTVKIDDKARCHQVSAYFVKWKMTALKAQWSMAKIPPWSARALSRGNGGVPCFSSVDSEENNVFLFTKYYGGIQS